MNHKRSDAFFYKKQSNGVGDDEEEEFENYVVEKIKREINEQPKPELVNYVVEKKKADTKCEKPAPKLYKPFSAVLIKNLSYS